MHTLTSLNQMEIDNLHLRTSLGREAKASIGGYAGGKPPIGYRAENGKLVIVPEEAEIVKLVFRLRKAGGTLMGIAEELNKRGYRTKKGIEFRHSSIQTILANEDTYRGHYSYGAGTTNGQHEAILDDDDGLNEKDIIRDVMKLRGWSQSRLAEESGFKGQSNITGMINRDGYLRIDNLYKLLTSMDCEIIVRDKTDPGREWKLQL